LVSTVLPLPALLGHPSCESSRIFWLEDFSFIHCNLPERDAQKHPLPTSDVS
jgi:hypothetical protein